ncbi:MULTISPECIES: septation ring formation regulator EzrA [Pontibacillus]|uniref:Septation ring formation regulator EzrA n=1 Tax=Pontibacillus chungwhensis TaxID=265426 RepID=A0ABY8UUZ6_9BACI|nr:MULTISPECIES: septation ring formation regulator EzrA [Pontibacillus]MCD5323874.1 septation ring formation regulator EzrA [Pontibacillus sp. HN14]WIF97233.1 septation ring formation regulator EzrA [Pontibacillus chungwhensis]
MAYGIGAILAVIVGIIVGLIFRKRVYDEVDRLESWKMDVMNREVTEELSKVKSLNLSGETQERFESWRSEWDDILSKQLPDLEEYLFDAEEYADKYRFGSARKVLASIEEKLTAIEASIDKMFEELDTLLHSEENSRKDIETLHPQTKQLRKKLLQQRHRYGSAEVRFEVLIDTADEKLQHYYQLVEQGNYFEANELVQTMKDEIDQLTVQIEEFPSLYKMCKQELPSQIEDLLNGLQQMSEDGYRVEAYHFNDELAAFQEKLSSYTEQLENAEMEEARTGALEIEERVNEMFAQLEKEAIAKSYVEKHQPTLLSQLQSIREDIRISKEEIEVLQHTYQFEDKDLEIHASLEKWVNLLVKQYNDISDELEEGLSHLSIREDLERFEVQLQELMEQHQQFKDRLHEVRAGEREAQEQITAMKQKLIAVNRKLQKSNIPGVPLYLQNAIEAAAHSLHRVHDLLDEQPLDMVKVREALTNATKETESASEQTELLLDQAALVETMIQYGNRYRSQYPFTAAKLSEAERSFRNYEYDHALELATDALEEVEPGARARLGEYVGVSTTVG